MQENKPLPVFDPSQFYEEIEHSLFEDMGITPLSPEGFAGAAAQAIADKIRIYISRLDELQ